jgi:hypothetical protein
MKEGDLLAVSHKWHLPPKYLHPIDIDPQHGSLYIKFSKQHIEMNITNHQSELNALVQDQFSIRVYGVIALLNSP